MITRRAQFADIPRLVELMQEAHGRSKYAERCRVDVDEVKQLFIGALQRDSVRGPGGSCVYVVQADGVVEGVILGMTERIYHFGDKLMATDVLFYVSERAGPRSALNLLAAFEGWASENPRIIEITLGISDVIDDPERLAKVYERRGYAYSGLMYERRTDQ